MIEKNIGKYQVLSEIGRGGMAVVYLAQDPAFRRQVAIKVLPSQFLENEQLRARFEREARTIAAIEHPAIVPVYDFGEQDGQLYLVMRYMPGGSLSDKIKQGALSPAEAIRIITLLSPALDAVHARGIVHRDLKPANILFDAFGNPALSDFGIAQLTEATIDLTGDAVIGTPSYMSPEQVRADVEIDGRSDIYALGVIFYEMLTGRQPYRAATPMSVAMKHLTDPVPQIRPLHPQFPPEVDQITLKAMAKERDQRYPHASDLAAALHALPEMPPLAPDATQVDAELSAAPVEPAVAQPPAIQPLAASPQPPPATPRAPAMRPPRPWLLPLGAGGLLVLGGLCLVLVVGFVALRSGMFPGLYSPASPAVTPKASSAQTPRQLRTAQGAAPTPAPSNGLLLLSDDFSTPANGWPVGPNNGVVYRYEQGAYHMALSQPDTLFWAMPDGQFTDTLMEVEASLASGGGPSYFGLLCRLQDANNFYYLVVREDGYFTIGRYQDGQFNALLPVGWTYNDALKNSGQPYRLRADCTGEALSLYLGETLLAEVQDGAFASGRLGFVAAAIGADASLEVVFDQLVVRAPQ